jgi:hypothetical protein
MNDKYIFNRKLVKIYKEEQNNYLKYKIQKIKSFIDLRCPESFSFYKRGFVENKPKNTCN